jgi:site-specific recombinase XerD
MARRQRQDRRSDARELEAFLDALALEGRSVHSVRSYRRDLEALLAALPGPLGEMRPADLREVFRRQQQAGRSPSSINRAIAAARSFCRFLWEEGRLETNPAQALRSIRLGPPLAPKHLTVAEVERLLLLPSLNTLTGRRDRAILMLLYNTGLRVGELCALNREDVRLPAEGWGALQVVGKGRRLRRLPVNRPAADALLSYLADRGDAVPESQREPLLRTRRCVAGEPLPAGGRNHRSLRPARAAPHLRHPCPARPPQSARGAGTARPCLGHDHPALHPSGGGGPAGASGRIAWQWRTPCPPNGGRTPLVMLGTAGRRLISREVEQQIGRPAMSRHRRAATTAQHQP